jgi:hypothetical protein
LNNGDGLAAIERLRSLLKESRIEQIQPQVHAYVASASRGGDFHMMHKGVEYTVAVTAVPSIWKWQFQIGETVKTGKTETKIDLLAIRRVQLRIDRELKKTTYDPAP